MEQNAMPVALNIGCGFDIIPGMINVDAYDSCNPDVVWDLNTTPLPWVDNSVDSILAKHIFEHLTDWWPAFEECARILKPGGTLDMRVPDESSKTALTYRDHNHVFSTASFHGIRGRVHGTNAWAIEKNDSVPLVMTGYQQVPFKQYNWMRYVPGLLRFVADHMRNFIWEQRFIFTKIGRAK